MEIKMRIAIVGRNSKVVSGYKRKIKFVNSRPDIVLSLGGDGTFLYSERRYSGVPKLLIRDRSICEKRNVSSLKKIIEKIKSGKYKIKQSIKLEAVSRKKMLCTNDFSIRNKFPTSALRLSLKINKKRIDKTIIGDGLVVSTPYGSTAYFYSITRKSFNKGIGVAFNNTRKRMKHLIVNDKSNIWVKILRGPALLSADNDPHLIELKENDIVRIKKSKKLARMLI